MDKALDEIAETPFWKHLIETSPFWKQVFEDLKEDTTEPKAIELVGRGGIKMSNNPKCPKCQSRTNCEGFYVMEIIVYKCVGKGCHARIYQDHNGYYTREGNTRHNIEREEVK